MWYNNHSKRKTALFVTMWFFIIQHSFLGNLAPGADCRPPAFAEEGSVNHSGGYPPCLSAWFYVPQDGKAVFYKRFTAVVCFDTAAVFLFYPPKFTIRRDPIERQHPTNGRTNSSHAGTAQSTQSPTGCHEICIHRTQSRTTCCKIRSSTDDFLSILEYQSAACRTPAFRLSCTNSACSSDSTNLFLESNATANAYQTEKRMGSAFCQKVHGDSCIRTNSNWRIDPARFTCSRLGKMDSTDWNRQWSACCRKHRCQETTCLPLFFPCHFGTGCRIALCYNSPALENISNYSVSRFLWHAASMDDFSAAFHQTEKYIAARNQLDWHVLLCFHSVWF